MAITRSKTAKEHMTASTRPSRTVRSTIRKTHSQDERSKPRPSVASKRKKKTASGASHPKLLKLNNDGPQRSLQERSGSNPAARDQQDNTKQHTTATSGFFKLPLELREVVYHNIWKTHVFLWVERFHRQSNIEVYYDEERLSSGNSPVWLLTSKQIFAEGMKQFERKGHIDLGPSRTQYTYAVSVGRPPVFATSGPLSPRTTRSLCLPGMGFKQWGADPKKDREEFQFLEENTHWIQCLSKTLEGSNKVEKLTLQIDHPFYTRRIPDISPGNFDLSPLQSLLDACPQLRILVVDIRHIGALPRGAACTRLGSEFTALAKNALGASVKVGAQDILRHEWRVNILHLVHTFEKQ